MRIYPPQARKLKVLVFIDKIFGQTPSHSISQGISCATQGCRVSINGSSDSECMCSMLLAAFSNDVLWKKFSVEWAAEAASRHWKQHCFVERCRCSIQVDGKFQNFEHCGLQNAKLIIFNWSHLRDLKWQPKQEMRPLPIQAKAVSR